MYISICDIRWMNLEVPCEIWGFATMKMSMLTFWSVRSLFSGLKMKAVCSSKSATWPYNPEGQHRQDRLIDWFWGETTFWAATKGHIVHPPDDMSAKSHGGMILTGKTEELGEKPVPVPLCPPQIPYGLTRASVMINIIKTCLILKTVLYSLSSILIRIPNRNIHKEFVINIPTLSEVWWKILVISTYFCSFLYGMYVYYC
jgi:hypothetical protein